MRREESAPYRSKRVREAERPVPRPALAEYRTSNYARNGAILGTVAGLIPSLFDGMIFNDPVAALAATVAVALVGGIVGYLVLAAVFGLRYARWAWKQR